jgi:hypothetical protein
MIRLTTVATLLVVCMTSATVNADDDRAAMAQEQMQQTFDRLELIDGQIEQVKPVLQASASTQRKILSRYGMDPQSRENAAGKPGLRQMRAMRDEMDAVRESTLSELAAVLSDEQLEEFKLIQKERQAEMKERMRAAR